MGVYIVACSCLDRPGPRQAYPGQAEVLREGTEGKGERGEEGQGDEKEETKLSGYNEVSGGIHKQKLSVGHKYFSLSNLKIKPVTFPLHLSLRIPSKSRPYLSLSCKMTLT